jgi:glutamyl-tRNA synthetase
MKDLKKKARAYALKNALAHEGKAQMGAVVSGLFAEGLKKSEMGKFAKDINEVISEVNKLSEEEQNSEFENLEKVVHEREVREGLPELPGAKKGKVVMRIAPSPSGPLHLPHAINLSLNYDFVEEHGGKLYVRIEDTNPETVYSKAYKMIEKEADWLTKGKAKLVIQSDRMNKYYDYAEKLIKKGAAYVCTCSAEDFKKLSDEQTACECRSLSDKENLERWEKMLDKKGFEQGEAVLRFKSDLKNSNPAMRDFPLARINETSHPKQKKKFRVWPLMNLSVTVDDIELGMTHVIRGKDHRDNAARQKMIYEVLGKGKDYPWVFFLGFLNFTGFEFSTRQMRADIDAGKYSGWADPELATVASLKKKGYKPEAFWKFAEHVGLSATDKKIDKEDFFEVLDGFNEEK